MRLWGEMSTTYVVRERGRLTMGLGVFTTRQNFGFPCSFFVLLLFVVPWQGVRRSTRARGRLSEAKTQRRPHSARESERGGFLCCFVVFVSFFQQGKKRHLGTTTRRGGENGEARRWCKKATA